MRTKPWLMLAPLFCFITAEAIGQDVNLPKVFPGARTSDVYRIRLDRGDLVLESVIEAAKKYDIKDGAVVTGLGSVQTCTYHGVTSMAPTAEQKFITIEGPAEILNINGIIADGDPHLHLTLSKFTGAFGGHLEKGCRVLYRAELTIIKFSGAPLARKLNREGTPLLQAK